MGLTQFARTETLLDAMGCGLPVVVNGCHGNLEWVVRRFIPDPCLTLWRLLARSSYTLYVVHFALLVLVFSLVYARFTQWTWGFRSLFLTTSAIAILLFSAAAATIPENRRLWRTMAGQCSRLLRQLVVRDPNVAGLRGDSPHRGSLHAMDSRAPRGEG